MVFYKRSFWKHHKKNYSSKKVVASKKFIAAVAKQVVKRREEVKAWEPTMVTVGATSVSTTPVNYNLSTAVGAGTSSFTRIGRMIRAKSLEFLCTLQGAQTGTALDDPYNVVRIIVYSSVDSNPLTSSGTVTVDTIINKDTFANLGHIFFDKRYLLQVTCIDNIGGTGYAPCAKLMHKVVKLKDLQLTYTTANVPEHTLYILFVSDSGAVPNPGIVGQISFKYTD